METKKYFVIVLTLILFVTPAIISEEFQISDTRQAGCVVHITFKPDIMSLSFEDIESLLHSSGVSGKAAQEVLDSTPSHVGFIDIDSKRSSPNSTNTLTYSFGLNIELPENVKPAANEFIKAMVDNLRESLYKTYEAYREDFQIQLETAQEQYEEAAHKLDEKRERPRLHIIPVSPEVHAERTFIHEQLEQVIDLSHITPETSFGEILDRLRNAVEPPLQIQPNWRDLFDMADIDRDTLCEMDPLTGVKLGKALDVLLEGLSITDVAELGYIVDDGVITIATTDTLPNNMVTYLYDISGFLINGRTSSSFIKAIMETIEPESWYDISETGEGNIVDMLGGKISVYNTPEIQDKLKNFLANFPIDFSDESVANVPVGILLDDKQDLERQRRQLELEVARLEARQAAAEQQIIAVSSKVKVDTDVTELKKVIYNLTEKLNELKRTRTEQHPEVQTIQKRIDEIKAKIASIEVDSVSAELKRLIETQTQQLETIKEHHEALVANGYVDPGPSSEITEAEEKLARLKIELARRREELARPVGVESLATLNENLSMTILDLAEKKAELQVVEKQLSEIEGQIRAASTTDPNILKIRQAKQALDRAEKRLNELKIIEENLQPLKVIVIGVE